MRFDVKHNLLTYARYYVIFTQQVNSRMLKRIEKRRFPRLDLSLPLHYKLRGCSEAGSSLTKDISIGGIRFITDRYIKPSTDIMLEINILSRVINPIGRIRWAQSLPHSNRYNVGLEFIQLAPEDKNYLSGYISLKELYP